MISRDSARSSASWVTSGKEERWYSRPLPNSRGRERHPSLSERARMRLSVLGNPGVLANSCAVYHSFMTSLLFADTEMAIFPMEAPRLHRQSGARPSASVDIEHFLRRQDCSCGAYLASAKSIQTCAQPQPHQPGANPLALNCVCSCSWSHIKAHLYANARQSLKQGSTSDSRPIRVRFASDSYLEFDRSAAGNCDGKRQQNN